jgi:hypothetical protein
VLWLLERRGRKAELKQEREDRRVQFEEERASRAEALHLQRMQVQAELEDRERERQKEQAARDEAEKIRRAPIRVGGNIVATELRANAEIAERCEAGSHIPSEGQRVSLFEWVGRRGEMMGLRDENPELWTELEEIYAALELTKTRGAHPPPSKDLLTLADRLDTAAEGHT